MTKYWRLVDQTIKDIKTNVLIYQNQCRDKSCCKSLGPFKIFMNVDTSTLPTRQLKEPDKHIKIMKRLTTQTRDNSAKKGTRRPTEKDGAINIFSI